MTLEPVPNTYGRPFLPSPSANYIELVAIYTRSLSLDPVTPFLPNPAGKAPGEDWTHCERDMRQSRVRYDVNDEENDRCYGRALLLLVEGGSEDSQSYAIRI